MDYRTEWISESAFQMDYSLPRFMEYGTPHDLWNIEIHLDYGIWKSNRLMELKWKLQLKSIVEHRNPLGLWN